MLEHGYAWKWKFFPFSMQRGLNLFGAICCTWNNTWGGKLVKQMTDFFGETWVDDDNKATLAVQNNGTEKIRTNFFPDFFRNFIFYWLFLIIWSFYFFLKYLFLEQLWSFKWRTFFGETWVDDNKATLAIQINGTGINDSKSQIKLNLLIMEYNIFHCVCP